MKVTLSNSENGQTVAASTTAYAGFATTNLTFSTTKANRDCTVRTAGTISNFIVRKQAGDRTGMTAAVMVGAGAGNSAIAFTSTNAEYEDTTHTDVLTAGQTGIAFQVVGGTAGTTSFQAPRIGCIWEVVGDTVNRLGHSFSLTISAASQTSWKWLGSSQITTQSQGEWLVKLPPNVDHVTLRNLYAYCSANTFTTVTIAINGATGTGTAPNVNCTTNGAFEDTTNSIQAKDGDKVSFKIITGTGVHSVTIETIFVEVQCDNNVYHWMICSSGGTSPGAGNFCCPAGTMGAFATEANAQAKMATPVLLKYLSANIITSAASSQIKTGINTVGSAMVVAGTATGWVTDSTHFLTVNTGDEIDQAILTASPTICCIALTVQERPALPASHGKRRVQHMLVR